MAIVTRYFSTTSAGAADGTTWADRAALLSAGVFNAIITGFSFAGSDSLICMIGPGTYTVTTALSVDPTAANPLVLHGCDSSGTPLTPPNPDWASCQPQWDDSSLPVLTTGTNIATVTATSGDRYVFRLLKFTTSASTSILGSNLGSSWIDWCTFTSTTSNSAAVAIALGGLMTNSWVYMNTSVYSSCMTSNTDLRNVQLLGNAGSSGNRHGLEITGSVLMHVHGVTIIGVGGSAFNSGSSSTLQGGDFERCLFISAGAAGVMLSGTASQTNYYSFSNCMFIGNGSYGLRGGSSKVMITNCRARNNATADFNSLGNWPQTFGLDTSASTNADEFVNSGARDYRIKNTSASWGRRLGPLDEPRAIAFCGIIGGG